MLVDKISFHIVLLGAQIILFYFDASLLFADFLFRARSFSESHCRRSCPASIERRYFSMENQRKK